ncbi:hypothetical protein QZH41_002005 [Actinostola sp. cb2023]|nr:hypothetical protein QZH41_002005 [Actinostola sp. cb2023]
MNNSTTPVPPTDTIITNIRLVFYMATFVIGMVGNILVIIVLAKKPKRSIHHMFILNLAVSDLTFLIFLIPINTYELYKTVKKPEVYCRFVYLMQTISYFISIYTITSMAIHRCHVIVNPYKRKMSNKSGYIWIALIWFISLVIVIPIAVVNHSVNDVCEEKWFDPYHAKVYTAALFVLQFLLPLSIIAIAYARIGIFLVRQKGPQTSLGSAKQTTTLEKKRKENKQIITTLAAIVIIFTICLFPGQIAWMVRDFGTPSQSDKIQVVFKFADILDFIHACVNPIIYGLLTDKFRKDYKALFTGILSCGKITITPDREASSVNMEASNVIGARNLDCPSECVSSEDIKTRASAYDVTDSQVTYRF